jgi:hypothetical protein
MSDTHEAEDTKQAALGFGKGGVPWLLMLLYLGFLTFFVWYCLEFQLPDFLRDGAAREPGVEAVAE